MTDSGATQQSRRKTSPLQRLLCAAQAQLTRDLPGAVLTYGKVLARDADNPRALRALRSLHPAQRRHLCSACEGLAKINAIPHALTLLGILRRALPEDAPIALCAARLHLMAGDPAQALEVVAPLAWVHPEDPRLQIAQGMALAGLRRSQEAIALLRPHHARGALPAEAIHALAASMTFLGQIDESRSLLLDAAQRGQLCAAGLHGLSRHTDISDAPHILDQLVTIFSDTDAPRRDRELAAYALASAHDHKQDFDTAFQFLQAANPAETRYRNPRFHDGVARHRVARPGRLLIGSQRLPGPSLHPSRNHDLDRFSSLGCRARAPR